MKKYILHIDTSGNDGVVYIAADGQLLHTERNTEQRNHASTINGMIDNALSNANIKMPDLAAVAVIGGPGSYTGLRIGLATAKGLCYALDIPLMMHNKLNLLAIRQIDKHGDAFAYYAAILPARSQEYYMVLLDCSGKEILPPQHIEEGKLENEFRQLNSSAILITGNATDTADKLQAELKCTYMQTEDVNLGIHVKKSLDDFDCNRFVSLYHIEPFYLKAPFTYTKL